MLISRAHAHRPERQSQPFVADLRLARARVHEICGPARASGALWAAAECAGPVIWITPKWQRARMMPEAMADVTDPGRFLFVAAPREEDVLWCAEEALRAGVAGLVVAELSEGPALTPVRRLHLAAETGGAGGEVTPLGLLLTPGEGGAQGVESRWHVAPWHDHPEGEGWRLARRRARSAPPATWRLTRRGGAEWHAEALPA